MESLYEPKLTNLPLASDVEGEQDAIDIVMQMRIMVGQNKDHTPQQLEIEARFIKNNFRNYSVSDIHLAMELFLNNRLDIDLPTHVTFSPLFISHVMNAYIRYKNKTIHDVSGTVSKNILELEQSENKKRLEGMKDCIRVCQSDSKNDFDERFFNSMVYDFLRKTKRLVLDEIIIEDGKKYAEKKFLADRQKNQEKKKIKKDAHFVGEVLKTNPAAMYDRKQAERIYATDYFLICYFKSVDVEKIIDNILESELPIISK